MRPALALLAILAALTALGACDSEEPEEPEPAPCAPGTAQIVLNECVLGLTLDSDSADIVARLGPPDQYRRDREGFGLRFYRYGDHPEAGNATVTMARRGLFAIDISDSPIRTASGIGSGTSRSEVRRLLGPPSVSEGGPNEGGFEFYTFEADSVEVGFLYDVIEDVPVVENLSFQSLRRGLFDHVSVRRFGPMDRRAGPSLPTTMPDGRMP